MTATVTRRTRIYNADQFIEAFSEQSYDVGYMYIGKDTAWSNELEPPTPLDNDIDHIASYQDLLAMKKISPANITPVIKRYDWVQDEAYAEYDPNQTSALIAITQEGDISVNAPTYVFTDDGNVYKCIKSPKNSLGEVLVSTDKPSDTSTSGTFTTADGYGWKFMYNVSVFEIQNFLTNEWVPVNDLIVDDGTPQWDVIQNAVDGAIHRVQIDNAGTGYLAGETISLTSNTGVSFSAEIGSVGGSGEITSINILNIGSGYRDVQSVSIATAGGSSAVLTPILSPLGGHGYNAREELFGIYVMVKNTFTGDEGGTFPLDTFRKLGVIINPLLDSSVGVELIVDSASNANFIVGDTVSVVGNSSINGQVVFWNRDTRQLWLTKPDANPTLFVEGQSIEVAGSTKSGVVREVRDDSNLPATQESVAGTDVLDGSGRILYIENRLSIQRNSDQSEEVRLVIEF